MIHWLFGPRRGFLVALVALCALDARGEPRQRAVLVGAMEDAALDEVGRPHRTVIRPMFRRRQHDWEAMPSSPLEPAISPERSWTACFDGRAIGNIRTHPSMKGEPYRFQGIQEPVRGEKQMFVGKRSRAYAGWMGEAVYRPLVLSSSGRCADPDRWHPAALAQPLRSQVIRALRAAASSIQRCENGAMVPYHFPDSEIVFGKSYRNRTGDWIVTLAVRLRWELLEPCSEIAEGEWVPHTFAIRRGGEPELLGQGMTLVDAGDYDGDGHSEVVFTFGGYNEDGYAIVGSNLSHPVRYSWSYH